MLKMEVFQMSKPVSFSIYCTWENFEVEKNWQMWQILNYLPIFTNYFNFRNVGKYSINNKKIRI